MEGKTVTLSSAETVVGESSPLSVDVPEETSIDMNEIELVVPSSPERNNLADGQKNSPNIDLPVAENDVSSFSGISYSHEEIINPESTDFSNLVVPSPPKESVKLDDDQKNSPNRHPDIKIETENETSSVSGASPGPGSAGSAGPGSPTHQENMKRELLYSSHFVPEEGTPAYEAITANFNIKVTKTQKILNKIGDIKGRPKLKNFNVKKQLKKHTKLKRKVLTGNGYIHILYKLYKNYILYTCYIYIFKIDRELKGKVIDGTHESYILTVGMMMGIHCTLHPYVPPASIKDLRKSSSPAALPGRYVFR